MAQPVDVIVGPPGAGKSVQAERLAVSRRYVHLSSGQLLRAQNDPDVAKLQQRGELVPSEQVERVIGRAIKDAPCELPILLDGFPRVMDEAEWLDDYLRQTDRQLGHIIVLEVPIDESKRRLSTRGRNDDTMQADGLRIKDYQDLTLPMIEHYAKKGLVVRVDGVGGVEEVTERIEAAL